MGLQGNYLQHPSGPRYLRSVQADYLRSPNGVFVLVQQSDGNLCIYHGTDPGNIKGLVWASDKYFTPNLGTFLEIQGDGNLCNYANIKQNMILGNRISLWCSGTPVGSDEYITLLENNGNLKLCRGGDPFNPGPMLWQTGVVPPLSKIVMKNVDYKTEEMVMTEPQIQKIQTYEYTNEYDTPIIYRKTFRFEHIITATWQAELGISIGVEAELKTGVPLIAEGKVTVSAEVSFNYSWGKSHSESQSEEDSIEVEVLPRSTLKGEAIMSTSQLTVPYTADITYYYQSGTSVEARASGFYQGSSSTGIVVKQRKGDDDYLPIP